MNPLANIAASLTISLYIEAEADLDAQVKILETLKQQADREAAALQSALDAVEKIKNDLPSLVEKMNAFATVWTKVRCHHLWYEKC